MPMPIFPNVAERVLGFYRSDTPILANQSTEIDSFIERIRQLFLNAQGSSFTIYSGHWADQAGMFRNLTADEDIAPQGGFSTGIQWVHFKKFYTFLPENLESLFSYTYPKLASLSPNTLCGFDTRAFVEDGAKNLTSLMLYLAEPMVKSPRGREHPRLACVCIQSPKFSGCVQY
ncbi:hypothetical protein DL89DRAFT_258172 [Linderina pennispora]|uniref:Uncharacterized protein n=1 Tax=Linderina pennispora TaxID=61395 RepID=A0A1Y1W6C3_9FUNG|nr:uncharacterized protein DL89DRAFT_258172 [Linderina pennispora]ORX69093.1 hypothetical protein DL89DRAFT_258172 [Linderina pennispora]